MNIPRILLLTQAGMIALFAIIQITASNFLATDGIDLAKINSQISVVQKENMVLREKVYTQGSLTEIASEAAVLGFIPEQTTEYVPADQPIAVKP